MAETCSCHPIGLNDREYQAHITTVAGMPRDQIVGYDWQSDCPEHGLKSEWYRIEGKAHLDETRQMAVDMQRRAREARQKARPRVYCPLCLHPRAHHDQDDGPCNDCPCKGEDWYRGYQ